MELIKSISIENTVAKRDAAVTKLKQLFDDVDRSDSDLAKLCGISLSSVVHGRDCLLFERDGLAQAIRCIDAAIWGKLLLESGIRSFMSSKDRAEWDANVMNHTVPELTLDNVRSTFGQLYADRGEMFADGVVAVFRSLSWDYKTNSPMAFGPKLILTGVWTDKGSKIFKIVNDLRAGVVWANTYSKFDPASPFGGYKESGFGREGGRHGLLPYLTLG